MRISIHREGRKTLLNVAFLIITAWLFLWYYFEGKAMVMIPAVAAGLLLFLFFLQFFRNPVRRPPAAPFKILAPADGKVVVVGRHFEKEVLGSEAVQVSIFMSPFNVHVNRYPSDGEVIYVKYHPGKYLVAWHPKSSELNERCTTALRLSDGRVVVVRQIAGILARRIVNYAKVGDKVKAGEEMGFIKFGSRADIFWSKEASFEPMVKPGEKTIGGVSRIA